MGNSFTVARFCWDDMAIVTASGDLDMATAPAMRDELDKALDARTRVVVDMAEVSFCDCAGASALVRAHYRTRRAGGELLVVSAAKPVLKLLQLTGLDRLLPCYDSVPAAIHARSRAQAPGLDGAREQQDEAGQRDMAAECAGCGGDLERGYALARDAQGQESGGFVCLSCEWLDNAERERWLLHHPRLRKVRARYVRATLAHLEERAAGTAASMEPDVPLATLPSSVAAPPPRESRFRTLTDYR